MSTPRLDCRAKLIHYLDHVAEIWKTIPDSIRGTLYTDLRDDVKRLGLPGIVKPVDVMGIETRNPVLVASFDGYSAAKYDKRPVALLDHGIGQSFGADPDRRISHHFAYPGGDGRDADLYLCGSEHAANRERSITTRHNRIYAIGCAKRIPQSPRNTTPIIALSFHWEATQPPEAVGGFSEFRFALEPMFQQYKVIGHYHPRMKGRMCKWYTDHNVPIVHNLSEVMQLADVFICDTNSSLYQFALTGKPVVVLNPSWFRKTLNHGLRFWDAAHIGPQVQGPTDWRTFRAALDYAIADPPELQAQRHDALWKVYPRLTQAPWEVAASALVEWVESL
jgi:hypothetical protein